MAVEPVRRVFVYGSLLWEPSLLRTLAHRSVAPAATPFVLDGWARSWNVVSARTFALADDPDGPLHRRLVLGLSADAGASCQGAVLDLSGADLVALVSREAAYELVAVTEAVSTFVPLPERTVGAAPVAEPLVVERAYLDECRAGIAALGLEAAAVELEGSLVGLRVATAAG